MSVFSNMELAVALEEIGLSEELKEEFIGAKLATRCGPQSLVFSMCTLEFERVWSQGSSAAWDWKAELKLALPKVVSDGHVDQIVRVNELKNQILEVLSRLNK